MAAHPDTQKEYYHKYHYNKAKRIKKSYIMKDPP